MRVPRVAINGFGRIGRAITRIARRRSAFDVVAVNDVARGEQLACALRYDTVHGRFEGTVEHVGDVLRIDGRDCALLREPDPARLPWHELEIDYVVESSGRFRRRAEIEQHLAAGAARVVLTVPCKDPLAATVVLGVNDHVVTPEARLVSNASCTTNCAAPLVKLLHDAVGVRRGLLTSVHAYTADQRLLDSPHESDPRRSRAAGSNIVPTSTGAARAIGEVIPELNGRFDGLAMRVPVADGSAVDMTVELEHDTSVEEIDDLMEGAASGPLAGILAFSREPIVSSDILGDPHSAIYDAPLTRVMDGRLAKLVAWYDNEWGYSARVADLIERLAGFDGMGTGGGANA